MRGVRVVPIESFGGVVPMAVMYIYDVVGCTGYYETLDHAICMLEKACEDSEYYLEYIDAASIAGWAGWSDLYVCTPKGDRVARVGIAWFTNKWGSVLFDVKFR